MSQNVKFALYLLLFELIFAIRWKLNDGWDWLIYFLNDTCFARISPHRYKTKTFLILFYFISFVIKLSNYVHLAKKGIFVKIIFPSFYFPYHPRTRNKITIFLIISSPSLTYCPVPSVSFKKTTREQSVKVLK